VGIIEDQKGSEKVIDLVSNIPGHLHFYAEKMLQKLASTAHLI
jgi:hypothetical protein